MDSITHIVLGATIGEAVAGKQLGKKAMLFGAIAQSIPDIDFIMSIWLRPVDNLLIHRGFTHSIFFGLLIAVCAGLLASRWKQTNSLKIGAWVVFFALEIAVHLILDGMNNYGVGWLEPFSPHRFSFNVIYVADPFFSLWSGIAFASLLLLRITSAVRKIWSSMALTLSVLYLLYTLHNKFEIHKDTESSLARQGITASRIFTTPTPLNNWLWFIAAETDSGYYITHRSVFDKTDSMAYTFFPTRKSLLGELKDKEDFSKLVRFSQGYYTLEKKGDALLFNDLRFGQIAGWADPHAMFAFHYDLYHPDANMFVVQQGRFSDWNRGTVKILIDRIAGRKNTDHK